MKAGICSDLHLEFGHIETLPDTEVIIIAGDYSSGSRLEEDINNLCYLYEHVVFTTGNHEYYGRSFSETEDILSSIKYSNFHWLENKEVKIGNTRIIGTTLWFPESFHITHNHELLLSDFSCITNFKDEVYKKNKKAVNYLTTVDITDTIIITHHLPSFNSIDSKFAGSALNRFFVSDLHDLIVEKQPKYWIHGHTHSSMDYMIGNTRIICNPLGYPFERNNQYSFDKIIEL